MEFKGKVTRVHKSLEEWSSGKIILAGEQHETGFAGSCFATPGTSMILYGTKTTSAQWGEQIKVESGHVDFTFDAQALTDYLADEARFENIGPVRARAMVERFGVDGFQALADDPTQCLQLAKVRGVTEDTAKTLNAHWGEARAINALMIAFRMYGLNHARAMQVVRALGSQAVQILEQDPYRLIDLAGIPFGEIDKVACKTGINKRDIRRVAGAIIMVLKRHAGDGHTLMGASALLTATADSSGNMGLISDEIKAAEEYRKSLGSSPFIIGTNGGGALTTAYNAEKDFFNWILESRGYSSQLAQRVPINEIEVPASLTEQQKVAFKCCLASSVTWVYGLAGTGKTHSARLICDLYEAKGMAVMLMAPTGKAAKRLAESTGRPAGTIHRSLACRPKAGDAKGKLKFSFEGDPIEAQLVVVDEVSMVDSELMAHLIRRIDLRRTSVIFLGDVNQLVPVGAGQPAMDVHRVPDCAPMVQLTEIVRQAGKLAHYCVDVLDNKVRAKTDYDNGWILQSSQNWQETHDKILAALESSWAGCYDSFADIQILTPQNKGIIGVKALNILLQRHFQLMRCGVHTATSFDGDIEILEGDKVIQTKNDYQLGIYNGDTGIVLEVVQNNFHEYKKGSILVDFGLIDPVWLLSSGGSSNTNQTKYLKLAYALTVHKAQGSEYPCVIAIVDKAHKHMLTRSWLYTAVTRAQTTICMLGQLSAAQTAAGQIHSPMAKTQSGRQTLTHQWLQEEDIFGSTVND